MKRAIKVTVFATIFFILMGILNYIIEMPNKYGRDAWDEYTHKKNINTLFVGSSVGDVANVDIIDSILGTNSINMSTPEQLYKTNYDAISFITRQQPIERVVMIIGMESLKHNENYIADHLFRTAMYMNGSVMDRVYYGIKDKAIRYIDWEFLGSTDSINIWFKWVKCPVKTADKMRDNIFNDKLESRKNSDYYVDMTYMPYGRKTELVNDETFHDLENDLEELSTRNIKCFEIDSHAIETFDCILRFLRDNNIEAVVMISPHRLDHRLIYGDDYDKIDEFLRRFIEKRGGKYINLDTDYELRELLNRAEEPFKDEEHLTDNGIKVVAPVIADRLKNTY